jgi:hypothetical protein
MRTNETWKHPDYKLLASYYEENKSKLQHATNSTEESPSWEADGRSARHTFPRLLQKPAAR